MLKIVKIRKSKPVLPNETVGLIFVQGDSVARGSKLLCIKNYIIEIMT